MQWIFKFKFNSEIKVEKVGSDSSLAKLVNLIESVQAKNHLFKELQIKLQANLLTLFLYLQLQFSSLWRLQNKYRLTI